MDEKVAFSLGSFFHGTKADLNTGDLLTTGFLSNYEDRTAKYVYFSGTILAACMILIMLPATVLAATECPLCAVAGEHKNQPGSPKNLYGRGHI